MEQNKISENIKANAGHTASPKQLNSVGNNTSTMCMFKQKKIKKAVQWFENYNYMLDISCLRDIILMIYILAYCPGIG